jgi:hypothetical protein
MLAHLKKFFRSQGAAASDARLRDMIQYGILRRRCTASTARRVSRGSLI